MKHDNDEFKPMMTREDGSSFVLYEMGMLVKETREDYNSASDHKEQFHFYVAGDFFNDETKKQNIVC